MIKNIKDFAKYINIDYFAQFTQQKFTLLTGRQIL